MDAFFNSLATDCELPADASRQLAQLGYVVVPGPVPASGLASLADAYDSAIASADSGDVSNGRTTIRVHDFVNRGAAFDDLYTFPPLLKACHQVLGRPFKLSAMLARTLRPGAEAQDLHVDFKRDSEGFPMVGFILMVDDFRPDNGATRFVPASHTWTRLPEECMSSRNANYEGQVLACGPAGSMIIYNGSVWHGHSANTSGDPRRSIQGAFIRREAPSGFDLPVRMKPDTLARITPRAKYLIGIQKT